MIKYEKSIMIYIYLFKKCNLIKVKKYIKIFYI